MRPLARIGVNITPIGIAAVHHHQVTDPQGRITPVPGDNPLPAEKVVDQVHLGVGLTYQLRCPCDLQMRVGQGGNL